MKSARKKAKKSKGFRVSKKGVVKIVSVVVIAAIFAWFFVITRLYPEKSTETPSYAAPRGGNVSPQVTLEAEDFSTYSLSGGLQVMDDSSASGGKMMSFALNTTADGNVSITNPTTKVTVTAKSDRCHGGPILVLRVDDIEVFRKKGPSASWNDYSADLNLTPGSHNVSLTLQDDYSTSSGQGCDRAIYVDKVSFY